MSEGLARLREAGSNQAHLDRFTTVAGWWRTGERDARVRRLTSSAGAKS